MRTEAARKVSLRIHARLIKLLKGFFLLRQPVWVLWITAGFTVIFALVTFQGFFFYDDINYLRYAHQVWNGTFQLTDDIHNHRFGLIIPLALMTGLLGLSDFSAILWPLLATLLTLVVIYRFVYRRSRYSALMAVWLFGTEYYIIFYSNKVYPDTTDTLFMMLGVMLLWVSRYKNAWYSLLPALAFFACLLTKETVIYVFPFLMWWIVTRFRKEQDIKRHLIFTFSLMLLLAVLFNVYYFVAGDYFYLIDTVQAAQKARHLAQDALEEAMMLFPRLTYEPLVMLSDSGMIAVLILSMPKLLNGWRCLIYTRDNVESIAWVYTVSGLLVFWFMSSSFQEYRPIPLNPRMFFPIMPGIAILAAFSIRYYFQKRVWLFRYTLMFLGAAFIDLLTGHEKIALVYLGFALLFAAAWYPRVRLSKEAFWVGFIALTALHPLYALVKTHPHDYFSEKAAFQFIQQNRPAKLLLLTDDRLLKQADFYFGFSIPNGLQIGSYCSATAGNGIETWLFVNDHSVSVLSAAGKQACQPPVEAAGRELLWKEDNVAVYRLENSQLRATSE
jgi:hypothetical protein